MSHSFIGRPLSYFESVLHEGPHGGLESLWVGEDAAGLNSVCFLYSLRQWIGGAALPVMGLGLVTVSPVHRRRGLGARLTASGLRHARERGEVASALYPFRITFYGRLGYGLAGEAYQYQLPPETLPNSLERARARVVRTEADHAAVRRVYDSWIRGQTGQIERTERSWAKVWDGEDRAGVVVWGEDDEPEGYAIVRYRADLPPDVRYLDVEERAWLTPAAQRALYGWLSSLGDQWGSILYRAHPEESFEHFVREPRLPQEGAPPWGLWFPAATLMRGPMFRLVDVPAAFAARPTFGEATLTLAFEVEDEQIPENRGPWRLRLEEGYPTIEQVAGRTGEPALRLPVQTLSRIFIGDLAPSAAVTAGLAAIDRPEALPQLDAAFRLPKPWTFDRF